MSSAEKPRKDAIASVRFDPDVIDAVKALASSGGVRVSEWIRGTVEREVARRDGEAPGAAPMPGWRAENPSLSFSLTAADQWQVVVRNRHRPNDWRECCPDGHASPEDAAAHGALLAAQAMSTWARSLREPAAGALVLAGKSVA